LKKIPTIFERDWNGDKRRVVGIVNPKTQWVFDGEGIATRKLDGTSCMIRSGFLYKRRELREGDITPANFEICDQDPETGKTVGWVPISDGNEDRWHREAMSRDGAVLMDGTYELVGPKIQGNLERYDAHTLVKHDPDRLRITPEPERTFDALCNWLARSGVEGIVYHHPDGRMAKIKARDFGIRRK
jgi:hypothetical protein